MSGLTSLRINKTSSKFAPFKPRVGAGKKAAPAAKPAASTASAAPGIGIGSDAPNQTNGAVSAVEGPATQKSRTENVSTENPSATTTSSSTTTAAVDEHVATALSDLARCSPLTQSSSAPTQAPKTTHYPTPPTVTIPPTDPASSSSRTSTLPPPPPPTERRSIPSKPPTVQSTSRPGNAISLPTARGNSIRMPGAPATSSSSSSSITTNASTSSNTNASTSATDENGTEATATATGTKKGPKKKSAPVEFEYLENFEDYDARLRRDNSDVSMKDLCNFNEDRGGKPTKAWHEKKTLEIREAKEKEAAIARGETVEDEGGVDGNAASATASSSTQNVDAAGPAPVDITAEPTAPKKRKLNSAAIQIRIGRNGEMMIDEDTLLVDHAAIYDEEAPEVVDVVDESSSNRFMNSHSFSKKKIGGDRWQKEETLKFYDGLSKFGTDFEMIAATFGGTRTRGNIRNKFKKESRAHPEDVDAAFMTKVPVSIEEYTEQTGRSYPEPPPPKTAEELEEERLKEIAYQKALEEVRAEKAKAAAEKAQSAAAAANNNKKNDGKGKNSKNKGGYGGGGGDVEIVGELDNTLASERRFDDWVD